MWVPTARGVGASVGLEMPFGGAGVGVRTAGRRGHAGVAICREDLDPPLEPRALWRREVSAALHYRL